MFKTLTNISWFLKPRKKQYIALGVLLLFSAFISTLTPRIIGSLIDQIALGTLNWTFFWYAIAALIAIAVFRYLSSFIFHKRLNKNGHELSKELRIKYLQKLFAQDAYLFEKKSKGDLISRLSNDMPYITSVVTNVFTDTIYSSATVVLILFLMIFTISLKLTIVAFLIVPTTFIILNIARNRMRKHYHKHREIHADFHDILYEAIEGQKVVRAHTQEYKEIEKINNKIDSDVNSWKKTVRFESLFVPIFDTVLSVSTFLTFLYGSFLVINSEITPGQLITFSMYINMISGHITELADVYNIINQASIGAERYFEILDHEHEVLETSTPKQVNKVEKIEFSDVTFKYPKSKENSLEDINLSIKLGQTIGIVGPTGSGKSTLIRQLMREFNVEKGVIKINDYNIDDLKIKNLHELIGYVPQEHILFSGSVKENLIVGSRYASPGEQIWAIDQAAFTKDIENLSNGLKTDVGERGNSLSGGQKQRLSIARALIKAPEILILDDSLSAVDVNTEIEIIDNLKKYRNNKIDIIITHRLSVVKDASKILVLENGKIIAHGTHEELLKTSKWYKDQYEIQTQGKHEDL